MLYFAKDRELRYDKYRRQNYLEYPLLPDMKMTIDESFMRLDRDDRRRIIADLIALQPSDDAGCTTDCASCQNRLSCAEPVFSAAAWRADLRQH